MLECLQNFCCPYFFCCPYVSSDVPSLIEEKFVSLRETFELENSIKQIFVDNKLDYPTEEVLRHYVNRIKKKEISFSDLEKEIQQNS